MWPEQSIGTNQENVDSSSMRGGMTMFWRVCLKITTTNFYEARRPDLMIIYKKSKSCQTTDVAIPEDGRVTEKEDEKVEKYQDLAREVGRCGV